jgi:hypothetical protein
MFCRYFIVIDDLWPSTWHIISGAFPDGDDDSRMLITTEVNSVAQECCDHRPVRLLISHQPTVLFSQNNQPPATSHNHPAVLFSQNKPAPAISHQPTEQVA